MCLNTKKKTPIIRSVVALLFFHQQKKSTYPKQMPKLSFVNKFVYS